MRKADHTRVRSLPLFAEMTEAHFSELMAGAYLQRFPEGVILISEGDLPDFLHVVVEGTVEVFASAGDRHSTIDIMYPIATFILAAVVRDEIYLKSARTLSPAQVLMIPASAVRDVFDRDARFARAVVNELAQRYRSLVRELKNMKLKTGIERLVSWIIETDRQQGGNGRVDLNFDKRTLASLLGMTPENLSRNLAALLAHGITSRGKAIIVTDRDALAKLAE